MKREKGVRKMLRIKNCRPRILYSVQLSYKNECEIKMFSDIWRLSFATYSPTLKNTFNETEHKEVGLKN